MLSSKKKNDNGTPGRKLKRQNSRLAWESRVTAPFIKLDLVIECRRLPKKNSFSQADAFCVLWEVPPGYRTDNKVSKLPARQEKERGRTEVVRDSKSPRFTTTFRLEYRFQQEQTFVVRVYDADEDLRYATDLKEHDFIGGCIFSVGELMGAGGCSIARPIQSKKSFVILTGQEIDETREVLEFRFSGQGLGLLERKKKQVAKEVLETVNAAKQILDHFDSYFRLENLNPEDQSWKVIWKSEVVKDTQNPTWNVARIPLQLLCNDNPASPLKITIFEWNRFTPDDLVGFVETTVDELFQKAMRGIPVFDVMFEKKKIFRGTKLKKAGVLKVLKGNILKIPSMLQYISGGCELEVMFAVDCTVWNGDWRRQSSLHYHSSTWLNDYQAAIHKIANIYSSFDGTHDFTLWGFGGIVNGALQHCFPLGEKLPDADALVQAYDETFSGGNLELELGPTAEIKHVVETAMYRAISMSRGRQCYSTLVILSTGNVSDVRDSIDTVCTAAEDAPLSIVVIGVGDNDFRRLEELTGDETGKLRHSNGVPVARDVVQFVAYPDFHGNVSKCVSEALSEVPEQFVEFYTSNGIEPRPPRAAPDFSRDQVFAKQHNGDRHHSKERSKERGKDKDRDHKSRERPRR